MLGYFALSENGGFDIVIAPNYLWENEFQLVVVGDFDGCLTRIARAVEHQVPGVVKIDLLHELLVFPLSYAFCCYLLGPEVLVTKRDGILRNHKGKQAVRLFCNPAVVVEYHTITNSEVVELLAFD